MISVQFPFLYSTWTAAFHLIFQETCESGIFCHKHIYSTAGFFLTNIKFTQTLRKDSKTSIVCLKKVHQFSKNRLILYTARKVLKGRKIGYLNKFFSLLVRHIRNYPSFLQLPNSMHAILLIFLFHISFCRFLLLLLKAQCNIKKNNEKHERIRSFSFNPLCPGRKKFLRWTYFQCVLLARCAAVCGPVCPC